MPLIRKQNLLSILNLEKAYFDLSTGKNHHIKASSWMLGNKCILAKRSSKTRQMCINVQRYDEALKTVARKHQLQLIPFRMSDHPQEHLYSYHAVLKQPATRGTNVIFYSFTIQGESYMIGWSKLLTISLALAVLLFTRTCIRCFSQEPTHKLHKFKITNLKKNYIYIEGHTITGALTNGAVSATIFCWYWGSFPTV